MGCHLWGRTESDATEATFQQQLVTFPAAGMRGALLLMGNSEGGVERGMVRSQYPKVLLGDVDLS